MRYRRLARRIGRTFWNDKVAAAQTVFFLVAAALFLPIVAGLFLYLNDTAEQIENPNAGLRSRAVQGMSQLVGSPGYAESAGGESTPHWEKNLAPPDPWVLKEMGLRDVNISGLSYSKIDNLQRGGLVVDPTSGFVSYPQFKDALRLGDKYDLHVRLYPVIHNMVGDPYGIDPIRNINVAYVANLTGDRISLSTHQFLDMDPNATAEIAALQALGLANFEGTAYQPIAHTPVGTNNYVNPTTVQQGDVIGDLDDAYCRGVTCATGGGTTKVYGQWFVEDYLYLEDGSKRFDIVVFGSTVDLGRWSNAKSDLRDYLGDGGTLIFLGNKTAPADFITQCATSSCLLDHAGAGAPVSTPDITNQMLSVPNDLNWKDYDLWSPTWGVCGPQRNGWIPVLIEGNSVNPCAETYFGATSSDRYGATGGTLILSHLDPGAELPQFLANLLSYGGIRTAYLDYGPEIPEEAGVASTERLLTMQLPTGDFLDVKIVFYLWKNDCTAEWTTSRGDHCLPDR